MDEEKKDETRKTKGISPASKIKRSFGRENLPSPRRAINQKNKDRVAPMDSKNPLLASNVTGIYGIKKNNTPNIVTRRVIKDNLLKNSTFFVSIILIRLINNNTIIPNNSIKY